MHPPPGFPALGNVPQDQSWASEMSGYALAFFVGSVAGFVLCKVFFPGGDDEWKDKYEDAEHRAGLWEGKVKDVQAHSKWVCGEKDKRIAQLQGYLEPYMRRERESVGWK